MAKVRNEFYKDGIKGCNIDREIHDIPAGEVISTSDNWAVGAKKIYSNLEIDMDGKKIDEVEDSIPVAQVEQSPIDVGDKVKDPDDPNAEIEVDTPLIVESEEIK